FGTVVNDTAFWLVDVYTLGINVTKIGNTTLAHVGDVIEYNITVINTEEATLNVTVDDTTLAYYNSSVTLGPGENASYIVYHTINETDKDLFLNTVNMT
ncbi:MAG: hypothetical protein GWN01_16400, partial [Nitrosopumilaceae archaeon]|nr:hypothetical protein [Nitrosopumilaceae archaeon]NIX63018.1 hypothetical protein [Nitrosopumilaceae archaeon]